ncbi:MAG TPA: efflux RND transporter periplasmic adaptor subunit, partial [Planctomycetaceae bacterium]|nr:efflux RND transporter periplasmic adaptor subunit [Planctomycetaceae bacterium]
MSAVTSTIHRSSGWLGRLASLIPNILVLGGLSCLFVIGPKVGWNPLKVPAFLGLAHSSARASEASASAGETAAHRKDHPAPSHSTDTIVLSEETVETISLSTAPVRRMDLAKDIVVPGEVNYDPYLMAELTSRLPGVVWRVDKRVGEEVKKGEVLALIDSAEVGAAKAKLLQAVVQIDLRSRIRNAMNESVNPARVILEAEAQVREARVTAYNAEQALRSLRLPIHSEQVAQLIGLDEGELAKRVQFLGLPPEIVATLDRETATANLIPLIAPFDGIVIGRSIVVGETVGANEKHFTVADVRQMWVNLEVRQEDAGKLAEDLEITFIPDGDFKTVVRGQISWISTEADDRTRTVEARAIVDNSQRLLHANTFGTGRIRVATRASAVVVPNAALQQERGGTVVFVRGTDVAGG